MRENKIFREEDTLSSYDRVTFLGAFAKSLKATISFVMHVRPSARNDSAPTGRIFMKFDVSTFRKYVETIQVSLKSDKNKGYFP
jgi:hypothetical protein